MAKYIDREALVEWLKRIPIIDLSDWRKLCRVIFKDDFKKAIKEMPKGIIADVAPVRHGRWIRVSLIGVFECSECGGQIIVTDSKFAKEVCKWCLHCGAKMDGSSNEE